MLRALQISTVVLVSIAMACALAHALEFPGKRRLTREIYLSVQSIYYPGFSMGGAVGEYAGLLLVMILLALTPQGSTAFWLTLGTAIGLFAMHIVYWTFTHPVNKVWLKDEGLDGLSLGFFSLGKTGSQLNRMNWVELRDRWEYSHIARAVLSMGSFIALVTAVAL